MYLNCFSDVQELTKELVKIPSIVKTSGEIDCAKKIHGFYQALPYFQQHSEYLSLQRTKSDEVERYNVLALVRGTKGTSNRTVILLGHLDTVGIEDYGPLQEYAYDPEKLPAFLKELHLGPEVEADLASGEYMFGRGALDMKGGVAGHLWLMRYFSEHPEELDGNLLAVSECDEEDNSHGIISALSVLQEWKEKYDLAYVAAINADYSTPDHEHDQNSYVYFGTIGKLLPTVYVTGKETHVGQAFGGLDPNLIVAELTRLVALNPSLCDEAWGEVTVPPVSLKQADCKQGYTVQTPLAAYAYYNFFTHQMSPKDVLLIMKKQAEKAFLNVINYTNQAYQVFCTRAGYVYSKLPWQVRVYLWEEFYQELLNLHGAKFAKHLENFAELLHQQEPSLDLRDFNLKLVEEAWQWSQDRSPAIIIFNSSIYFASIALTGKTENEKRLLSAVQNALSLLEGHSKRPIVAKMFYPYISDSSFMALGGELEKLEALAKNTPAWGQKYTHPSEAILQVNVPIVNIGTFGKDGHKFTERVLMKYSFETVPNLTYHTICHLLD